MSDHRSSRVVAVSLFLAALALGAPALAQPVPVTQPTGFTLDPVTNTWFVVTAMPPRVAQVSAATGALVTAPHNLAAAAYVNPMPLAPGAPGVPASMANLAAPVLVAPGVLAPALPPNPTGVALDFFSNTLYITDSQAGLSSRVIVVAPGPDGVLLTGDDQVSYWNTSNFVGVVPPLLTPHGIAFNPLTKTLLVVDQAGLGVFEISTTGVTIGAFPALVPIPVGIAYDPTTRNVHVLGAMPGPTNLTEFTPAGTAVGAGSVPGISLTDVAYNTSAGLVFGLEACPDPPACSAPVFLPGAQPTPGPANGGTGSNQLTAAGGILSDHLASAIPLVGPSALLLAPAGVTIFPPGGPPGPTTVTIANVGPGGGGMLSNMFSFTPTGTVFNPPVTMTLPLFAQAAAGTPVGLFVFGQATGLPAAPLKSIGTVDPSGMTATFPGVGFFSFVTAVPANASATTLAAVGAGGLAQIVKSFGLPGGIERSLLAKLEAASKALTAANAESRRDAVKHLRALLNEARALAGSKLSPTQAQTLAGTVEGLLELF